MVLLAFLPWSVMFCIAAVLGLRRIVWVQREADSVFMPIQLVPLVIVAVAAVLAVLHTCEPRGELWRPEVLR